MKGKINARAECGGIQRTCFFFFFNVLCKRHGISKYLSLAPTKVNYFI